MVNLVSGCLGGGGLVGRRTRTSSKCLLKE